MIWTSELMYPGEYSINLGHAHLGHHLRLPHEEHVLMVAPPRTGKSGLLADIILTYPGPVLSTTTREDIRRNTIFARQQVGRVDTFNPQGVGGIPSSVRWDPIEGCLDIATAIRRADAFAAAVSAEGVEDGAFWQAKTSDYLRAFFHAAAIARTRGVRYGLPTTARWALGKGSVEAEELLLDAGAADWASQVAELRSDATKTIATLRMYLSRALGFLLNPMLAACVLPQPDEPQLDIERFVTGPNTLYMIATGQGDLDPVGPLFAALAGEVHWTAGMAGSYSPGGRLPNPMLCALDEIVQVCPVPLPEWLADSGGKGIQVVAVTHGEGQLRKRWGVNGARSIMDCAGTWVVLPGVSDDATLKMLSALCGTVAIREHGGDAPGRHPVATEDMIRQLPDKHALVKRTNRAPVICRVRQVWEHPLYRKYHGKTVRARLRRLTARRRVTPPVTTVAVAGEPQDKHGEAA